MQSSQVIRLEQISLVILTSRFEAASGLFGNGPRHFEPSSDDEDEPELAPACQTSTEAQLRRPSPTSEGEIKLYFICQLSTVRFYFSVPIRSGSI
ncbi:hypothetical protein AVEN_136956-1 [Araneus ventricosus]|uniref:Uncharacterized protein n=1 Tax=Araneus ventricosus TaxID=182803 RepID=A0A4Y2BGW8_ARAVE|nr:hypothetical protein AVEN_136956-1 [Araneus ventricosus]